MGVSQSGAPNKNGTFSCGPELTTRFLSSWTFSHDLGLAPVLPFAEMKVIFTVPRSSMEEFSASNAKFGPQMPSLDILFRPIYWVS